MATIEEIILRLKMQVQGLANWRQASEQQNVMRQVAKNLGTDTKRLAFNMNRMSLEFQKVGGVTRLINTSTGETISSLQGLFIASGLAKKGQKGVNKEQIKAQRILGNLSRATKGFRFELLSSMFFAGGLSAALFGMLAPAFKLSGIFEIFTTILQVLFLPIALAILPPLLFLLGVIIALPPEVKLFIGAITLLGAALLGIIAFFVSIGLLTSAYNVTILGLAKQGFGTLRKDVISTLSSMKVAFLKFTAFLAANPIILILIAIIAAVILLNEAWKNNWGGIRQHVGNFVQWFSGIFDRSIKPVLSVIGTGIIVLKNAIVFTISNIQSIWESIWLRIFLIASNIWNLILSGIEAFVNAALVPIQALFDAIRGIAGLIGIEIPQLKFQIDLDPFKAQTLEAQERLAEVEKGLRAGFIKTLIDTQNEVNSWNAGLDSATVAMRRLGEETVAQGNRIDAGLEVGRGFIPGLEGGIGGLFGGASPPTQTNNSVEINIDANVNDKIDMEELAREIEDRVNRSLAGRAR